ncbi:hypothetical protein DL96DRAFT_1621866 [Flagelloscypha sp. PMI_526]|nr:hypothetical protein DL96DRAFT_1621866 [Flagelloscypha sp. PMI_526]
MKFEEILNLRDKAQRLLMPHARILEHNPKLALEKGRNKVLDLIVVAGFWHKFPTRLLESNILSLFKSHLDLSNLPPQPVLNPDDHDPTQFARWSIRGIASIRTDDIPVLPEKYAKQLGPMWKGLHAWSIVIFDNPNNRRSWLQDVAWDIANAWIVMFTQNDEGRDLFAACGSLALASRIWTFALRTLEGHRMAYLSSIMTMYAQCLVENPQLDAVYVLSINTGAGPETPSFVSLAKILLGRRVLGERGIEEAHALRCHLFVVLQLILGDEAPFLASTSSSTTHLDLRRGLKEANVFKPLFEAFRSCAFPPYDATLGGQCSTCPVIMKLLVCLSSSKDGGPGNDYMFTVQILRAGFLEAFLFRGPDYGQLQPDDQKLLASGFTILFRLTSSHPRVMRELKRRLDDMRSIDAEEDLLSRLLLAPEVIQEAWEELVSNFDEVVGALDSPGPLFTFNYGCSNVHCLTSATLDLDSDSSAVGCRGCSRCFKALYCSRECQAADWKRHRPSCKPPVRELSVALFVASPTDSDSPRPPPPSPKLSFAQNMAQRILLVKAATNTVISRCSREEEETEGSDDDANIHLGSEVEKILQLGLRPVFHVRLPPDHEGLDDPFSLHTGSIAVAVTLESESPDIENVNFAPPVVYERGLESEDVVRIVLDSETIGMFHKKWISVI